MKFEVHTQLPRQLLRAAAPVVALHARVLGNRGAKGESPLLWGLACAVCLILQGAVNMMPPRWIARFFALTGAYQLLASLLLIVLVPAAAPSHQSAEFVFTTFDTSALDASGIPNSAYLFILGMLMSQYTVCSPPYYLSCLWPVSRPSLLVVFMYQGLTAELVACLALCRHGTPARS